MNNEISIIHILQTRIIIYAIQQIVRNLDLGFILSLDNIGFVEQNDKKLIQKNVHQFELYGYFVGLEVIQWTIENAETTLCWNAGEILSQLTKMYPRENLTK